MTELYKADDRMILALDEPDLDSARALVKTLGDSVSYYKIGLTLLAQGGLDLARELKDQGKLIFQDWKLHDIGAQVEGAAKAACSGACDLLTVHAEPQVMRAAVKGRGNGSTKIIGVTVMTSLSQADLDEMGYGTALAELVMLRVDQAVECGLDGVVASPHEAAMIRARVPEDFLIVTPGVRPEGSDVNDQQRIATPQDAFLNGASHVVVGRPITRVADPVAAAQSILAAIHNV
ncbi:MULTISPECIES: orotidine-5'-phosphate decarboxylase [Asticcacaulis]|uniref:orotidine-5'-phosphate decarboxylase n=1 Tax=Asticcacaulis TaxID=76890 RepID=UPI001AE35826|nr:MULTISPECIES: orotidine-5'-phosphate decarboxylase [Asticcacaulis]MBP2159942.1 orotidine-5'-phosphate decarboxylase [Asticcacaulis solisilvae]MDR6800987.1 orotidine-5'-phosphate decarboxylase [Asticcacaulis sp. BE141]